MIPDPKWFGDYELPTDGEEMRTLNGYKTYLVALFVVLGVVMSKLFGWDIPGFHPGDNWMDYVLAAAGLGAMRHGVSKTY